MKNILLIFLMLFSITFFSSCGDKKTVDNTSKDSTKTAKKDTIKAENTKDTTKKVGEKIVEKKDTTSTVRQTEKTQVEEP